MFKKLKLLIFLGKMYDSLMKIRFIKALMALISVLMSYKIIKFLWYLFDIEQSTKPLFI